MFSTSTIIAIQMVYVKHLPIIIAVAFFLTFGFFDGEFQSASLSLLPVSHRFLGLFWGASLKKIPQVRAFFTSACPQLMQHAGRMGSSHVGLDHDVDHALLDVG